MDSFWKHVMHGPIKKIICNPIWQFLYAEMSTTENQFFVIANIRQVPPLKNESDRRTNTRHKLWTNLYTLRLNVCTLEPTGNS